jgi:hypothetical protein
MQAKPMGKSLVEIDLLIWATQRRWGKAICVRKVWCVWHTQSNVCWAEKVDLLVLRWHELSIVLLFNRILAEDFVHCL